MTSSNKCTEAETPRSRYKLLSTSVLGTPRLLGRNNNATSLSATRISSYLYPRIAGHKSPLVQQALKLSLSEPTNDVHQASSSGNHLELIELSGMDEARTKIERDKITRNFPKKVHVAESGIVELDSNPDSSQYDNTHHSVTMVTENQCADPLQAGEDVNYKMDFEEEIMPGMVYNTENTNGSSTCRPNAGLFVDDNNQISGVQMEPDTHENLEVNIMKQIIYEPKSNTNVRTEYTVDREYKTSNTGSDFSSLAELEHRHSDENYITPSLSSVSRSELGTNSRKAKYSFSSSDSSDKENSLGSHDLSNPVCTESHGSHVIMCHQCGLYSGSDLLSGLVNSAHDVEFERQVMDRNLTVDKELNPNLPRETTETSCVTCVNDRQFSRESANMKYGRQCRVAEFGDNVGNVMSDKLSYDQLMFLFRLLLSRYKKLYEDYTLQASHMEMTEKSVSSQGRYNICLIQALVCLCRKMQYSNAVAERVRVLQRDLQEHRRKSQHRQTIVHILLAVLICLHVMQIAAVRRKLRSWLRAFGIVETWRSINRAHRNVSENWRNIPSFLTNFWRIFIFKPRFR